jgi:hypothetical protein
MEVTEPRVIAIDWSGRKGNDQVHHIRSAVATSAGLEVWADLTREAVIDELLDLTPPVVVGFDFAFGFPGWVGEWLGFSHGPDLWPSVQMQADTWLKECPSPFFGAKGTTRPAVELLRRCDARVRAKSVFQIAGAGHVGTGSLRGMPLLTVLRKAGYRIWPFDGAGDRMIVEIYPTRLREIPHSVKYPRRIQAMHKNDNTRDAVISACVMYDHRESFAALEATNDPVTQLEGDVWIPSSSP